MRRTRSTGVNTAKRSTADTDKTKKKETVQLMGPKLSLSVRFLNFNSYFQHSSAILNKSLSVSSQPRHGSVIDFPYILFSSIFWHPSSR